MYEVLIIPGLGVFTMKGKGLIVEGPTAIRKGLVEGPSALVQGLVLRGSMYPWASK